MKNYYKHLHKVLLEFRCLGCQNGEHRRYLRRTILCQLCDNGLGYTRPNKFIKRLVYVHKQSQEEYKNV